MRLRIGDHIENASTGKVVEIVQVRATGYTWRTVSSSRDVMVYAYRSDDTSDPFFDNGWRLLAATRDETK